jgi:3-oxoadipate enol-lactonase
MLASVQGTGIYYEQAGDGLPIVFMHGLGGTGNVWHAQRAGLAKYFRVITIDLPGSGRSDRSAREYSMEGWVEQVAAFADGIQLDKFVLVGHSMTTVLAQKFAARYGSRLTALVLCGPLTELGQPAKEAFTKRAETVLREGMMGVVDTVLSGALTPATHQGNAALAGLYREVLLANDPACYAAHCRALIAGSARADQANIRCPTLVLVGDQDGVTPLTLCRQITAAVPGACIRVIPGTAHMTMLEQPTHFNAALIEFLAGL